MKRTILSCVFLFGILSVANAQINWGIKGGLNYSSNGDLINETEDIISDPDGNAGYHLGVFLKTKGKIFLKPELVYTNTNSDYDGKQFNMKKLDAPVLVGFDFIGPLNIFAGPAFQYILDTDLEDVEIGDIENDFTIGLHVGIGAQFGKLGIDLRYETGLSENLATIADIPGYRLDTRPKQIIAGVSYTFK